MNVKFDKLERAHADKIYDFLGAGLLNETIFSKTILYAWPKLHDVCIHSTEDYILIAYKCEAGRPIFISPLVRRAEDYMKGIKALERFGTKVISQVNEWQAKILEKEGYELRHWPERSEYLYRPEDLISLKGKRYNGKRNHINRFEYDYEFRDYREEDRQGVIDLIRLNIENRIENGMEIKKESLLEYSAMLSQVKDSSDNEVLAINRVLDDLEFFNTFADVLIIDKKIVGFASGEILPNGIGGLYFQKADIKYKGIYQILDNLFCKKRFANVRYINKQEDMGIPGLRRSKESYYPVKMADLYSARRPRDSSKDS